MRTNLVMFDIDGTLTATNIVDTRCFVQAIKETLNIDGIDTDWSNYRDATDSGIAAEIIERHKGYYGSETDLSPIRSRFIELLQTEASSSPDLFLPIQGAAKMLRELEGRPGIYAALATGAWRESAVLKLNMAGLEIGHLPMASSNDTASREEIMAISYKRACSIYQKASFDSVVYVGDGIWDLRASRSQGYHFIGVANGNRATHLKDEGAEYTVSDFSNIKAFFGILEKLWNA
jgi:phosphoglycolate phosphatase-like HAD superfamily hydrolase